MSTRKSAGTAFTTRVFAAGLFLALVGLALHIPPVSRAAGAGRVTPSVARKVFIISHLNGQSVCRIATPTEDNQLAQRAQAMGLHRLISDGTNQSSGTDQVSSGGIQTPGLNIILLGTPQLENFPMAKAAFIKAAANWQAVIQTPITIVIDVDFGPTSFGTPFDADVLGQTDSQEIGNGSGYQSIRSSLISGASNQNESTLYNLMPVNSVPTDVGSTQIAFATSANLRALGLMNPVANPDGEPFTVSGNPPVVTNDPPAIAFNSNFQFDFDPTNGIDSNKTDFDAVATHEIGHVLGFTSEVGDKELAPTDPPLVSVWDIFRFRTGTTPGTFATATRIQHSGGTQVFYNGGPELGLSTGRVDGTGGDQSQASHWKAQDLTGVYIGIMDPFISDGQRQLITNNDILALNTFGYRTSVESPAPYTSTPTGTTVNLTSGVGQTGSIIPSADPNICQTSPTQYKMQVPVDATQLTINLAGTQDVDLHARAGLRFISTSGWPGIGDYTSNSSLHSETIVISSSSNLPLQPGSYYIAVDNCGSVSANFTVTATVNSATTTSAIDDTNYFVTQHYADFLNRVPDQSGLAFWISQISACGSDPICLRQKRIDVSDAFFFEQEYQQTGAYVYRLYRASYGNTQPFPDQVPDPLHPGEENKLVSYSVFGPDRALVVGGASLAQSQLNLANSFVLRPEFLNRYPASLDGPGFVDAVLATIKNDLGTDLTAQRAALINLFNQGGRGNVIYRLADDNVGTNPINNRALIDAEYNRAFVATEYFGYLRRDPDMAGFLFWLGQVNNGPLRDVNKQHAMVCSFITSNEYQFRFGNVASHSNSECPQ